MVVELPLHIDVSVLDLESYSLSVLESGKTLLELITTKILDITQAFHLICYYEDSNVDRLV